MWSNAQHMGRVGARERAQGLPAGRQPGPQPSGGCLPGAAHHAGGRMAVEGRRLTQAGRHEARSDTLRDREKRTAAAHSRLPCPSRRRRRRDTIEAGAYNVILTGAAFLDSATAFPAYWADAVAPARATGAPSGAGLVGGLGGGCAVDLIPPTRPGEVEVALDSRRVSGPAACRPRACPRGPCSSVARYTANPHLHSHTRAPSHPCSRPPVQRRGRADEFRAGQPHGGAAARCLDRCASPLYLLPPPQGPLETGCGGVPGVAAAQGTVDLCRDSTFTPV